MRHLQQLQNEKQNWCLSKASEFINDQKKKEKKTRNKSTVSTRDRDSRTIKKCSSAQSITTLKQSLRRQTRSSNTSVDSSSCVTFAYPSMLVKMGRSVTLHLLPLTRSVITDLSLLVFCLLSRYCVLILGRGLWERNKGLWT